MSSSRAKKAKGLKGGFTRFGGQFLRDLRTPLYKNAIFLLANTAVIGGLGIIFWMVVTRYYTPYEVGLAAAIIPMITFLAMLSRFGFDMGLVRFLPSSGKNSRAMINSCLTLSGAAAILISIIFVVGLQFWSPSLLFIRENGLFLASFVTFTAVVAMFSLVNQVFVARRSTRFVLVGSLVGTSRIAFAILFATYLGTFGIFASWSLSVLLALLVGMLIFMPILDPGYRPIPTVRKNIVNDMIHFSAGNYVAGIFSTMPAALLPLLILHTLPAESVAYYYIAFTIAGLLFSIAGQVSMSLFAEGVHFERKLREIVRKAVKLIFLLLIPAVVLIILFGDYLLLLFGTQYSMEGFNLLRVFAISSIFLAFNTTFIATRRVLKRIRPIVIIPVFNALVVVGLGCVLLNWMGLIGIAIAWVVSQGLVSAAIGVHIARTIRREPPRALLKRH